MGVVDEKLALDSLINILQIRLKNPRLINRYILRPFLDLICSKILFLGCVILHVRKFIVYQRCNNFLVPTIFSILKNLQIPVPNHFLFLNVFQKFCLIIVDIRNLLVGVQMLSFIPEIPTQTGKAFAEKTAALLKLIPFVNNFLVFQ